mgnify:CR=1 FL=1
MKKLFLFILPIFSFSQTNTEVHLFDIVKNKNNQHSLVNGKNISNNKGYDSQPYFYDNNTLIFASSRDGQPDIAAYTFDSKSIKYINTTPNGGEYSPQRIPNSKDISAVRLDNDGKQRFYKYDFLTGRSTELIKNLVVAYPLWYDENTLISSVIVNDTLQLHISDLVTKSNIVIDKEVGRSLHKIPNTKLISFTKKNKDRWELWSLDPKTKVTKKIVGIGKNQDVCWLPNGTLLFSSQNMILQYIPNSKEKEIGLFHMFNDENINNISRIMVNKEGTKIALVAETSPRFLAQEQLEGYNKRDIEAFLKPYAKDVKVYTFPDQLDYTGIEEMRKRYSSFFKETTDLHCAITKRIVKGNVVIDEELVTANGGTFKAVAIYEITNGKISSVRFLR